MLPKNYLDIRNDWNKLAEDFIDDYYEKILEFLKNNHVFANLSNARIAELGCGNGVITEWLANQAKFIHGVDYSPKLLQLARNRLKDKRNVAFSPIIRDFSILTDLDFDIVLAVTCLENLPEPMTERIFQDARRILKEKGHFVFRLGIRDKHKIEMNKIGNPALDTVFWTKDEIKVLAEKYRYKIIKIDNISILQKA